MTSTSDLALLAARFACLPAEQRRVFMTRLAAAGVDFRLLPIPALDTRLRSSPASHGQTRIWLHARMIDDPAGYHITLRLAVDGVLDRAALRRAFDALVERHESLRTGFFETEDGDVEQRIEPPMPCPWRMTDLTPASGRRDAGAQTAFADATSVEPHEDDPPRIEQIAADIARREAAEPFDLARAPLVRAHLIACSPMRHWLIVTLHHIVADGWSIDIALHELSALYDAYSTANAGGNVNAGAYAADRPALKPLPIQYADYAQWQRHALEAGEAERQLAFWRARLDASAGALALPGARARPMRRSAKGARHRFALDAALGARVRALAQARAATPFAVLLAALHGLLARASGETRIQIGVPAANRTRAETAGVIGCFVNTVVVPADVELRGRFETLVDEVQSTLVDAQSNEEVPFEHVVDALGVKRSASHHPLFQVMASYAGAPTLPRFGQASASFLPADLCSAKFDLALGFEARDDGGYDAAFVYAEDMFDAQEIARFAARLRQWLTGVLTTPEAAIGDIEWLSEADRDELAACNGGELATARPLDIDAFMPIHERIAALAAAAPHASAVADAERTLTRGELEARAGALAQRLVTAGVGPEVRVGIALSRSVNLFVALLAIMKTGGAFVPLDPAHPVDRLAYIADDAGIDYLISEHAHAAKLPQGACQRVWFMDDEETAGAGDTESPAWPLPETLEPASRTLAVPSTQCAYLIYTSGSTGKPKGVVVEHGPLAMHCGAIVERYGMREDDCVLHVASINFDGAHECWMAPLAAGARVRITDDALWSAAQTIDTMKREGVTIAAFTPGYALQLAEWTSRHGAPATLRSLTVGGEATSREAFRALRSAFPGVRIVNGYGPTETVVTPLLWMIGGDEDARAVDDAVYLPIGTPIGDRTAHVLDAGMRALPVGAIGELYLGGSGVARGYHARPALTAERFVPDPYGRPGARLYRTGDLVRRRRDGALEFMGRVDHQVKLRGLRIELGEIESRLIAHPRVRDAVALVRGGGADATLVAYVELADAAHAEASAPIEDTALDAYLRRSLPDYMVPARIILLDRLPRNANRKIDRASLPAPALLERSVEPPMPGIETALAHIWSDVLKVERIGRHDDFFAIGGHSLKAVAVAARVAERLGRAAPIRALFEAPTLAAYAQRVREAPPHAAEPSPAAYASAPQCESAADTETVPPYSPARLAPTPRAFALSDAQASLWFLWRASPRTASHHIAVALRLHGELDMRSLERAIATLAHRHPALRTGVVDGANPRAIVTGYRTIDLPLDDLRMQKSEPVRLDQAKRLTDEDALRPFPMAGEPLWRARLIRLADDDHVLSLVIHHVVADGRSIAIWLDGLRRAYLGELEAADECLPMPTEHEPPHRSTAAGEGRPADGRAAAYWRAQLLGAPVLSLPAPALSRTPSVPVTAMPVAAKAGWGATRLAFAFERVVVERARTVANDARASLPMLMHAAMNIALARQLGVLDQSIGTLASVREGAHEDEMGLFVHTLIVRTRMAEHASLLDVLSAVRDATLSAYEHMAKPLTEVLEPPRAGSGDGDGHPLLAALFNYVKTQPAPRRWGTLTAAPFNDVRRRMLFEIELDIAEDEQSGLSGALSFAHERIDESFARRLALAYREAVVQLASAPTERVLGARPPVADTMQGHDGGHARVADMEIR